LGLRPAGVINLAAVWLTGDIEAPQLVIP
jgi:hypothetical protein